MQGNQKLAKEMEKYDIYHTTVSITPISHIDEDWYLTAMQN